MNLSIDAEAQARIVDWSDERLVVVAGAGSGKTTNLVKRVAAAITGEGRADPTGIAIITFTDKAARELVHKLRVGARIEGIDRAYIGTIHGFCQRILRQYPIEVGLPPAFTTADEITSSAKAAERRTDLVNQLLNHAADDAELREAIGVLAEVNKLKELAQLVALIDRDWNGFAKADLSVVDNLELARRVEEAMSPIRDYLDNEQVRENAASDPLAAVLNGSITDWMRGLRSAGLARISLQDEPPEGLGNKGGRAFWNAATGETDKQVRDVVKEAFASAAAHAKDAALRHILRVLAPMAVAAARQRLADGELGFDDLLVLTHQLLSEHPSVRAELRTQITHLFVDEFQDTDPLQFEIISMLCDTEPGARGPVLFAVGDPKQAIYAFRSADVRLFNELAATADQAGYLSKLVANHRTRPDVAKWINATVSRSVPAYWPAVSRLRALTTTVAPSAPRRCANARPMPRLAPVTSAIFPSSNLAIFLPLPGFEC